MTSLCWGYDWLEPVDWPRVEWPGYAITATPIRPSNVLPLLLHHKSLGRTQPHLNRVPEFFFWIISFPWQWLKPARAICVSDFGMATGIYFLPPVVRWCCHHIQIVLLRDYVPSLPERLRSLCHRASKNWHPRRRLALASCFLKFG